jgi:hypothetical protein
MAGELFFNCILFFVNKEIIDIYLSYLYSRLRRRRSTKHNKIIAGNKNKMCNTIDCLPITDGVNLKKKQQQSKKAYKQSILTAAPIILFDALFWCTDQKK